MTDRELIRDSRSDIAAVYRSALNFFGVEIFGPIQTCGNLRVAKYNF